MNQKIVIILTVIGLIVVAVMFSQQKHRVNEQIITSDDGAVKLTIPLKALPKGVDMRSVKVSKVLQEKGNEEVFTYSFEPDGLSLSQPAQAKITLNQDVGNSIPVVLHSSNAEVLPLKDVSILRDDAKKQTIVTAKLSHFSSMTIMLGMFRLSISSPDVGFVGEQFKANTYAQHIGKTLTFDLGDGTSSTDTILDPWTVEGFVEINKIWHDVIQPQGVLDVPAYTKVLGQNQTVNASAQFTCVKADRSVFLTYQATLTGEIKSTFTHSAEKAKKLGKEGFVSIKPFKENISVFSELFECKDLVTKASPTSKIQKTDTSNKSGSDNLVPLDVLIVNNKFFAAKQFDEAGADVGCQTNHYHAKYEVSNIDIDTHLSDPSPTGCGFGTVDSIPRRIEMVSKEKAELFK